MISSAYDDQVQAAIRDAGRWIDTNTAGSDWLPQSEVPAPFIALGERFRESRPDTHQPCGHLKTSGPQPAHWFTEWPGRAFCSSCAQAKVRRLKRKRRPCVNCGTGTANGGHVAIGTAVIHGPLCGSCRPVVN